MCFFIRLRRLLGRDSSGRENKTTRRVRSTWTGKGGLRIQDEHQEDVGERDLCRLRRERAHRISGFHRGTAAFEKSQRQNEFQSINENSFQN